MSQVKVAQSAADRATREVAVVMPAYNEEEHVVEQIDAVRHVLDRTDWAFQIILVDDGSSDDTATRAESAGVTVIRHRRNRGYGSALKRGIASSEAPWILIIDADGRRVG